MEERPMPKAMIVFLFCAALIVSSVLTRRSVRAQDLSPDVATIQIQPVLITGLSLALFVTGAHDGSNRLFIVEQGGLIKVLQPGQTSPTVFLDISSRVLSGGEQGLLGLAFHPQFSSNHRLFVNYTRPPDGATVIAEYRVSATNQNMAGMSETVILTIPQPFSNHNGGMIEFGPDGFLYIGMGDGGSGNDPGNRAQNIDELLGKILRIDIDHPNGAVPYSSPSSNPFFGATPGADEIFSIGMRNPWRFSFDRGTGQLYAGDVGQNAWEEIDIITNGGNYGWRVMEGNHCNPAFNGGVCTPIGIAAIAEYGHTGGRCSVTGGYVYRGPIATLPAGSYVYGDYCTGEIFVLEGGTSTVPLDTALNISSFGEDEVGEVYVVGHGGQVYRIVNPNAPCSFAISPKNKSFRANGGTGSVVVTAPVNCGWTAVSNDSFITINAGASGTGVNAVTYSIAANISGVSRTGTLTVAGQTVTVNQSGVSSLSILNADFDGDSKTDLGFNRDGLWGVLKSAQNYSLGSAQFFSWGGAGLQPIMADFDGDGKADIAYMVPPANGQSAVYSILKSSANYDFNQALFVPAGFPGLGDTPVVGDFDGDGKDDPGIWRASTGVWIIPRSSANYGTFIFSQWGQLGDIPMTADFDGDGKADIGFYRNGLWGVLKSGQNYSLGSAQFFSWGGAGLQPIVGDFDGDGKADIGYIVPPSGGQSAAYAILKSSTGYSFLPGDVLFVPAGFPVLGDTPVVGDFDGDGKDDPGIWRESQGIWIIPRSSSNYTTFIFSQWGRVGDIAFPNSTGRH
jgi:glucose/arabinose dehydrogenase